VSDYADLQRRDRRRDILGFVAEAAGYTSNGDVLLAMLRGVGHWITTDQIVTDLHWLREQGFVDLDDHEGFVVVTATVRGIELAAGIARHPEVSRPRPGH
jgi:hypothetical protein